MDIQNKPALEEEIIDPDKVAAAEKVNAEKLSGYLNEEQLEQSRGKKMFYGQPYAGAIHECVVGDKVCYFIEPTNAVVELAYTKMSASLLKYLEVIFANCWLTGDEAIKTDRRYKLGVLFKMNDLIGIKEATLSKR